MLWLISGIAHGDEADRALPSAPGVYDVEYKLDGGRTARFTLSLPEPRSGLEPPLVLVMHYAGTPTRFYGRPLLEELVEPAFRPLHAVYVAPESINGQWHTEENEAFVMRLIDTLIKTYDVDSARIIVTGYSMGDRRLALRHPLPRNVFGSGSRIGLPQRRHRLHGAGVHFSYGKRRTVRADAPGIAGRRITGKWVSRTPDSGRRERALRPRWLSRRTGRGPVVARRHLGKCQRQHRDPGMKSINE